MNILSTQKKYPSGSTITKLDTTLPIKQTWLYNEWSDNCQFSKYIKPYFHDREELDSDSKHPNIDLINSVFHEVRGQWLLWQTPREEGRWKKVETSHLNLNWVKENVEVLYPSDVHFSVSSLNGIVLWDDQSNSEKRYKLYEGNHRISAWLASQSPQTLPALIFIGKPKKV